MTHTPGPWTFSEEVGGSYPIYPDGKFLDPWIGEAKGTHVGPDDHDEILANARLMAAAPELLEVLKAVIAPFAYASDQMLEQYSDTPQPIAILAARRAIAKAEKGNNNAQ